MKSTELIKKAEKRYKQLKHKEFDRRSFLNGYFEGYADNKTKMTPSQIKTIKLMTKVHNGGTAELLPSGDVRLNVPPILPQYYRKETLIISRRGKIIAEYLTNHYGDVKENYS